MHIEKFASKPHDLIIMNVQEISRPSYFNMLDIEKTAFFTDF